MFRRVHEILSKKFPKWVFEENQGPLDWSILPVEMKREIVKYTDFETKCRLRQCSKQDQQIVESFQVNLPFVRIETDKNFVSITICESKEKVMRMDLQKKKLRLRKKFLAKKSQNCDGKQAREYYPQNDFDVVVESILQSISKKNVFIETLILCLKYPEDSVTKFLSQNYREQNGPKKTKILCSGLEFLAAQVYFLHIDEARIVAHLFSNYESGDMMFAGKVYNVSPSEHFAGISLTTFWKPRILGCNLGALIAGIMSTISGEMVHYFIPGLQVSDSQEIASRFEGRITKIGNIEVLHIPVPHTERKLLVKIGKCGVVIEKVNLDDLQGKTKNDGDCCLEWMCANCDKSLDSWYYRTNLGIERSK